MGDNVSWWKTYLRSPSTLSIQEETKNLHFSMASAPLAGAMKKTCPSTEDKRC